MTPQDLLYIIARDFKEKNNYGPSKTKLIKLAYLVEVFFKRQTGKRLTDGKWLFWHYGPYLMEYPKILSKDAFKKTDYSDFQPVDVSDSYLPSSPDVETRTAIAKAMEFADDDLYSLLDFVYFDTEPMMNASKRGEPLNFDCVASEDTYKVKRYRLNDEIKKDIRQKLDVWKEKRGGLR